VLQVCKKGDAPGSPGKKTTCIGRRVFLLILSLSLSLSPSPSPSAKPFQSRIELYRINWVTARLLSLRGSIHAVDYAFVSRYTFSSFSPHFFDSSFFIAFFVFFLSNATEWVKRPVTSLFPRCKLREKYTPVVIFAYFLSFSLSFSLTRVKLNSPSSSAVKI